MSQPVVLRMPERIGWDVVDLLLRDWGFDPHQVDSMTITRNITGQPVVTVEVHANGQQITRVYDTARSVNGVRVTADPEGAR